MRLAELDYRRGDNTTGVWVFRVWMQNESGQRAYVDRIMRDDALRLHDGFLVDGWMPPDAKPTTSWKPKGA